MAYTRVSDANEITAKYMDSILIEQRLIDSVVADISTEFFGEKFDTPVMTPAFSHLGKYDGNMALVYLKYQIISLDPAFHIAVVQQQGGYACIKVIALFICDYLFARAFKNVVEVVGNGGLSVSACDCDYGAVHFEGFKAVFIQLPQHETGSVARVLAQ